MGNRDHLVPSMTVDKNGHAKTVYVSPSGGTQRSMAFASMPTLSSFTEHEDEEDGFGSEWEGVSDPDSWISNDFNSDDAQDWEYAGFDADDAYQWNAGGFGFSYAKEWSAEGFTASDAKDWENYGFDSNDAKEWSGQGFTPDVANEWRDEAFDNAETSAQWRDEGFEPSEATNWFEAGFKEASDASEWKGAGKRKNLDAYELAQMVELNLLAEDAPMWSTLLDTVHRMEGGKDVDLDGLVGILNGVNPSAGDAYAEAGYPLSQWKILSSNFIEFDKVPSVRDVYSKIDEKLQDDYGDDYEEDVEGTLELAASWIGQAEGFNRPKMKAILSLIEAGHKPSDVDMFLTNRQKMGYKPEPELIINSQNWAASAIGTRWSTDTQKAFERFYNAASEMGLENVEGMLKDHGAEKVERALSQGMTTEPQLRNYLENISIAAISEGAL